MSHAKKWLVIAAIIMLVLVITAGNALATRHDVQGLVFIDDNLNGVWDAGEAGYGGEWQWVEDEEMFRYVGATVTFMTPAYDEITIETTPYRELEEHETVACTQQDMMIDEDDVNPNAQRPCSGTWGLPVTADQTWLEVTLTVPEGYYATSDSTKYCLTGEDDGELMDFGIAPMAGGGGTGGPVTAVEEAIAAVTPSTTYQMTVEGTGFVPGLVFVDNNLDGVWQPGEPGYDGVLTWIADEAVFRYMGATITLISPAYDEWTLTSAGYREPEENETITCTQQDLIIDGEFNPNPVRPCSGTWGMGHAGDDVRWEVILTAPEGYYITSANPQYYVTGSGQMPVDFGIALIADK